MESWRGSHVFSFSDVFTIASTYFLRSIRANEMEWNCNGIYTFIFSVWNCSFFLNLSHFNGENVEWRILNFINLKILFRLLLPKCSFCLFLSHRCQWHIWHTVCKRLEKVNLFQRPSLFLSSEITFASFPFQNIIQSSSRDWPKYIPWNSRVNKEKKRKKVALTQIKKMNGTCFTLTKLSDNIQTYIAWMLQRL